MELFRQACKANRKIHWQHATATEDTLEPSTIGSFPVAQCDSIRKPFVAIDNASLVGIRGMNHLPSQHLMPPDVLVRVSFANGDDGTTVAAFNQIAAQKFRQPFNRRLADLALHLADAA